METTKLGGFVEKMGKVAITYAPLFAKFRKRMDAYADRAVRMAEYATCFHAYISYKDQTPTVLINGLTFQKVHPGYLTVFNFKTANGWQVVKMDELKAIYRWSL